MLSQTSSGGDNALGGSTSNMKPRQATGQTLDGRTVTEALPGNHVGVTTRKRKQAAESAAAIDDITSGDRPDKMYAFCQTISGLTDKMDSILVYPFEGTGGVSLTVQDLSRLDDEEFLNDSLIEFGLK